VVVKASPCVFRVVHQIPYADRAISYLDVHHVSGRDKHDLLATLDEEPRSQKVCVTAPQLLLGRRSAMEPEHREHRSAWHVHAGILPEPVTCGLNSSLGRRGRRN